jgi:phage baseplate assembly protein W
MNRTVDVLGVGWAFPVGVDARGGIALARRELDVEQSILMIVMTPKGQRVMRPEFGCLIHELVFAPNNHGTAALAARYVEEALAMWEPRIEDVTVDVTPLGINVPRPEDRKDMSGLLIDVSYKPKSSNDQRSLVFPFYTIPGE